MRLKLVEGNYNFNCNVALDRCFSKLISLCPSYCSYLVHLDKYLNLSWIILPLKCFWFNKNLLVFSPSGLSPSLHQQFICTSHFFYIQLPHVELENSFMQTSFLKMHVVHIGTLMFDPLLITFLTFKAPILENNKVDCSSIKMTETLNQILINKLLFTAGALIHHLLLYSCAVTWNSSTSAAILKDLTPKDSSL